MNRRWPILAAVRGFACGVAAGYAWRSVYRAVYAHRRKLSPQQEARLRNALRGDPRVTRMAAVIGASLEPGDRVEALTAAVRAADGHLDDRTMRPEWVAPVISSAVPAKARGKR